MSLRRMRLLVTLIGSAMLLIEAVPSIAALSPHQATSRRPAASGTCSPNKLKFIVSEATFSSSSTTFVDVPETSITFTQGGTKPACTVVSFSSEAGADAGVAIIIEAVLDDVTICLPGDNEFLNPSARAQALADRAMNYICPT